MKNTPDFIIVGPPKTATTWLFKCMEEHSEIFIPEIKQCHYFDRNYDKGQQWYLNHFPDNNGKDIKCGDITPDYISTPDAPQRIYDTCGPDVKIIIIHRDPLKRSHSEYLMKLRSGKLSGSFTDAISQDSAIIKNSLYHKNVSEFLKLIPKENVLILPYQNIVKEPEQALANVFKFLNIEPIVPKFINTYVNKGGNVSRYKGVFVAGISLRKKIESSVYGRKILSKLRDWRLFDLWHKLVLKKNKSPTENNLEFETIYRHHLQSDDLAMTDLLHREFNHSVKPASSGI